MAPGSRHWFDEVGDGSVGVYHPGDEHTAHYTSGVVYGTVTLSYDRLEEEAAKVGLILGRDVLGGTRIHPRRLSPSSIAQLKREVSLVHGVEGADGRSGRVAAMDLLRTAILHFAREPIQVGVGNKESRGFGRIVSRALEYIDANLGEPILLEDIASAASTSQRTLHRAFLEVLSVTPKNYVKALRG